MAGLMILNPRRTRKAAKTSARRRKMTAKQLRYFGPRRARKAAAPKKKKRRAGPAKIVIVESNPKRASMARKRKSGGKRRRHSRKSFLSNPKRARRRFRRNPRIPGASIFNNAIVPGMIGAAGALGVDVFMASVPMPAQLRRGYFVPVVKIAVALLIGMGVSAVSNREAGEEAAAGGVIVTLYGLARNFMLTRLPNVPLGRYVPMRGMGMRRYVPMKGMGYGPRPMLPPNGQRPGGLAYYSPARNVAALPSRGMARHLATR